MKLKIYKIVILILFLFNILFLQINPKQVYANSNWARVTNTYALLYKTTINNHTYNNVYCILENTYFVEILKEEENHYFVNYNNINGYVKKTDVTKVIATPQNPFPSGIKMKTRNNNCNLRTSPTVNSNINNIATIIPANSTNIVFYGKIYGDEIFDFEGNTWYFVNYLGINGYIYSEYFQEISPILPNTENINLVKPSYILVNPLNSTTCIFIIILTIIPCVILFTIILKKPKLKKAKVVKMKTATKKAIKNDNLEDLL